MTGIIVASMGFWATYVYDQRSRAEAAIDLERGTKATELQTVEKFFPHLLSPNQTEKQGALEAINELGNAKLVAVMGSVFGGSGARQALNNVAGSAQGEAKAVVEKALTDLYVEFGDSILRVYRNDGHISLMGTGFLVTDDGTIITAKHIVMGESDATDKQATSSLSVVTKSGETYPAVVVRASTNLDLAILKVSIGKDTPLSPSKVTPLSLEAWNFHLGDKVSAMGYRPDSPLFVTTGNLIQFEAERFTLDLDSSPGMGGSPILNSSGQVIGVLVAGTQGASRTTFAVPVKAATSFFEEAGIPVAHRERIESLDANR